MVFIEPLSGTTIEHKYLSRITFDFCWASFWINNRWCEWHNTSVCMDDVVSCMVWSEHDRYPRLVLYSPAVWFFDCTGIAAGFWIANTSASLLCFERSIYMSFIWQTLYEKGSVRVCWMSDWMHDWITWWGVYRPRVVWNMTDMSTLWLSGVPPLSGPQSWLGMVPPLVLYSPAVSCSDCCQIADCDYCAMCVSERSCFGGVCCAVVSMLFRDWPFSGFDVATFWEEWAEWTWSDWSGVAAG